MKRIKHKFINHSFKSFCYLNWHNEDTLDEDCINTRLNVSASLGITSAGLLMIKLVIMLSDPLMSLHCRSQKPENSNPSNPSNQYSKIIISLTSFMPYWSSFDVPRCIIHQQSVQIVVQKCERELKGPSSLFQVGWRFQSNSSRCKKKWFCVSSSPSEIMHPRYVSGLDFTTDFVFATTV